MEKLQKIKKLSLNTILFTISGFGSKIVSFLLVPLYTYMLSTNEYGNLDLMSMTAQLLIPFLTLNIQDAVLRFALDKEIDPKKVINVAMKVFGIGSLVMFFLLLFIESLHLINLDNKYVWYLFALFVSTSLYNIFSMFLRAIDKIKLFVICGLLNTIVTCGLNILFLLVLKLGVVGYMGANIIGSLISIILMFFGGEIFKSFGHKETFELFLKMASYSLPLVANSVAWWINTASDRYILTFFCGATINGIYAVSYKIPTILSTVQGIFYNSWSISAITEFEKDDKDGFIGNVYMSYSCISIISCSIILLFNILIAKLLYAKDFFEAWHYVPPLLVGMVFNGIALFEGCIFTAVKKTKEVSKSTIVGSVLNTIFNFILIPSFGALGASISTMIGYITIWLVRTYKMNQIVKIKMNWSVQIVSFVLLLLQSVIALCTTEVYLQIPLTILIFISQLHVISSIMKLVIKKFR